MPKGNALPAASVLLLLLNGVAPKCQEFPEDVCQEHKDFVPGHSLAGRGFDITTLQRKGANLFDMHQWENPDGSCTLCQNPLLEGKPLQRLPLVVTDWEVDISSHRKLHSSLKESGISVVEGMGTDVKNDWKMGLEVEVKPQQRAQVTLAGSHSKMADFSIDKSGKDKYSFASHEVASIFYKFRIGHHQPLSQHFKRALKALPPVYHRTSLLEYHQFIETYGTHFITKLALGGRVRDVTAIRECETVLDGMNAEEVKDCLSVEASASVGAGKVKMDGSYQKCEEMRKKQTFKGSFHQMYTERHTEIVGGNSHADLLFSDDQSKAAFQEWIESLKTMPGLVSYSLAPIHNLVAKTDPKRESLRTAVSEYVTKRALWRNCTQPCPPGTQRSAHDPCSCVCPDNSNTNSMCCSKKRGLARLTVTIRRAHNLWGDYTSRTDAYVKVSFQGKESRTPTVWNNNNPVWEIHFDLGTVQLLGETSKLRVQVWDEDNRYDDDILGTCDESLQAGERQEKVCYLNHGRLDFQYHLVCGHHLGGHHCLDYTPQRPKYEGAFLQRMSKSGLVSGKASAARPTRSSPLQRS